MRFGCKLKAQQFAGWFRMPISVAVISFHYLRCPRSGNSRAVSNSTPPTHSNP